MINPDEAIEIILAGVVPLSTEDVALIKADKRILAKDIFSPADVPPFDKSAMDGYAYRKEDEENLLTVTDQIAAGDDSDIVLKNNECVKIMTGAKVPQGADSVVRVEFTELIDGKVKIVKKDARNIAYCAEDIRSGEKVLERGMQLSPASVAVLASLAYAKVEVYRKPKVALICTGSELLEPGEKSSPGKIYNSNAYQLMAQIKRAGAEVLYYGIVRDEKESLKKALEEALQNCDVLLLTGGVSMGDFDFVPGLLKDLGAEIQIQKINIKPGRPTVFAKKDNSFIFGLPGNPVSSFVIFEIFVRPLLAKLQGAEYKRKYCHRILEEDYQRKKADRVSYLPVYFMEDDKVSLKAYHGSAHINAYVGADAMLAVAPGVKKISGGERVEIILL